MPRFSVKTMMFVTSLVATFFCAMLLASGRNPQWAMLPMAMYAVIFAGWCVYRETRRNKEK